MGVRLKRSIKILQGIRVNLSKSGVSTSVGKSGATLNFNSRGTRATVGLPGSGLSYSEKLPEPAGGQAEPLAQRRVRRAAWIAWIVFAAVVLVAVLALRGA
jgi:hypothetical protein